MANVLKASIAENSMFQGVSPGKSSLKVDVSEEEQLMLSCNEGTTSPRGNVEETMIIIHLPRQPEG